MTARTPLPCLLLILLLLNACGTVPSNPAPAPGTAAAVTSPAVSPSPPATNAVPTRAATALPAVLPTVTAILPTVPVFPSSAPVFPTSTLATRNTYYLGLGPQMHLPCHLLYDGDLLRLDPNNCPLRLTLTERVGVTRYFGLTGEPEDFTVTPDLPAYRQPGFALLACAALMYNDNICQYTLTDPTGTYRLEIRVTGVE